MFKINLKQKPASINMYLTRICLSKNIAYWIIGVLLLLNVLTACGSGATNNSTPDVAPTPINPTDVSALNIISAWDIPTLPNASQSYILVQNTANIAATNLQYSLTSTTDISTNVIIDSSSLVACSTIAANSSCQLLLDVPANANTTGVVLNVTTNQVSQKNIKNTLNTLAATSNTTNSYLGVGQINYNNNTNADGITLVYPHSITTTTGNIQVLVNAIVGSTQSGTFNTINLVDANGNPLNTTVISNNSGSGAVNLTQGSIVTFLLTVPAGTTQLALYPQTAVTDASGNVILGSTATSSQTITTTVGAVPQVYPFYFDLSSSNESQTITIHNSSATQSIGKIAIVPSTPLSVSNDTCTGYTLLPNTDCSYTVSFDVNNSTSGNGNIAFIYNDGVSNNTLLQSVQYTGGVQGGLSLTGNFNFISNNLTPSITLPLTITNTGNYIESNLILTLPSPLFSVNTALSNSCTIVSSSGSSVVLADSLSANQSCALNLTYNNSQVQTVTPAPLVATYTVAGQNASTQVGVTYQTTAISASMIINNGYIISPKIGGTQVLTLQLSTTGGSVSSVPVNVSIESNGIASIVGASSCNLSSIAGGNTCFITVQGVKNATTVLDVTLPDGSNFSESIVVSNQYLMTGEGYNVTRCVINQPDGELYCDASPQITGNTLLGNTQYASNMGNQYIYFNGGANNSLTYCTINSDGTLSNCNSTGSIMSLSNPMGMTNLVIGSTPYLYVGNYLSNAGIGVFSNFNSLGLPSTMKSNYSISGDINGMSNIKINGTTYLYVAVDNSTYVCTLNAADGTPTNCNNAGATTTYSSLNSYATNVNGSGTPLLYSLTYSQIESSVYGVIQKCTLQANGTAINCSNIWQSNQANSYPYNISINSVNGTYYAYIGIENHVYMQKCVVNSDGSFGACVNETPQGSMISTGISK